MSEFEMSTLKSSKESITLRRFDDDYCIIHLYGSTLISWMCDGKERIFLSSKATFESGKSAIRGGIPIVFPNFGPWNLGPQHGFARLSWWKVEKEVEIDEQGNTSVSLSLVDDDFTRKFWDYKFKLVMRYTLLKKGLQVSMNIQNLDSKSFSSTCLLHTYFKVDDVCQTFVDGLSGSMLIDKINKKQENVECDELSFHGLTDSEYRNTKNVHHITCQQDKLEISKSNFKDTAIWNPWWEKCSEMKDMDADRWKEMICVECGCVGEPLGLNPSEKFSASQTIKVL